MHVLGNFDVVNLESALNITEAEFYVSIDDDPRWIPDSSVPSSSKIFDHLPHIQRLEIKWCFLKYLSLGVLPEKLPKPCQYLKVLSMDICFDDPDEILTALCILRSSSALQKLKKFMNGKKKLTRSPGVVEEQKSSCFNVSYNCTLYQLRLVNITGISGVEAELDFVKFLLLGSPMLERMTVTPSRSLKPVSVDGFLKLVKELLQFKRESKHAELILLDP
ncbi:hypothetical protein ACLB2K_012263 [Fragaria x ananassa]